MRKRSKWRSWGFPGFRAPKMRPRKRGCLFWDLIVLYSLVILLSGPWKFPVLTKDRLWLFWSESRKWIPWNSGDDFSSPVSSLCKTQNQAEARHLIETKLWIATNGMVSPSVYCVDKKLCVRTFLKCTLKFEESYLNVEQTQHDFLYASHERGRLSETRANPIKTQQMFLIFYQYSKTLRALRLQQTYLQCIALQYWRILPGGLWPTENLRAGKTRFRCTIAKTYKEDNPSRNLNNNSGGNKFQNWSASATFSISFDFLPQIGLQYSHSNPPQNIKKNDGKWWQLFWHANSWVCSLVSNEEGGTCSSLTLRHSKEQYSWRRRHTWPAAWSNLEDGMNRANICIIWKTLDYPSIKLWKNWKMLWFIEYFRVELNHHSS